MWALTAAGPSVHVAPMFNMQNDRFGWSLVLVALVTGCGDGKHQHAHDTAVATSGDTATSADVPADSASETDADTLANPNLPSSIREAVDLAAVKALTLEELGWKQTSTRKESGVTIYFGDWWGPSFLPTRPKATPSM